MRFVEIGRTIRDARLEAGRTQAELALACGLTRTTVNQIESGLCPDLGAKKLMRLAAAVGFEVSVTPKERRNPPDYLRMASVSVNVGFKESIGPDELAHIVLTGRVPKNRRAHLRYLFEEVPASVVAGMVRQLSAATPKPQRIEENIDRLARQVGVK